MVVPCQMIFSESWVMCRAHVGPAGHGSSATPLPDQRAGLTSPPSSTESSPAPSTHTQRPAASALTSASLIGFDPLIGLFMSPLTTSDGPVRDSIAPQRTAFAGCGSPEYS